MRPPIGPAERYLTARVERVEAARELSVARGRPGYLFEVLVRVAERRVTEAREREGRALLALDASPESRWDLGGGIAIERVAEATPASRGP